MAQELSQNTSMLKTFMSNLANDIFAITQIRGQLRSTIVFVTFIVFWNILVLWQYTDTWIDALTQPLILTELFDLFLAYFEFDVLRHLVVSLLAYWAAFRLAAIYLDDIFELEDASIAARFIKQAAFSSIYDRIAIQDGRVAPEDQNSPIARIGGPGLVRVNLENAAVFEKINGKPHIIGPAPKEGSTTRRTFRGLVRIEGFERLRQVIDLRDLVIPPFDVQGRTKDGIPITARNVRGVFSIYRGPHDELPQTQEEKLKKPYPFSEKAIQNLVYSRGKMWSIVAKMSLQGQLRRFIGQHTLSEFLANVSSQELAPVGNFVPRDAMTREFFQFQAEQDHDERGFEIQWLSVGSWKTREQDHLILERHLEAWEKMSDNRRKSGTRALYLLRIQSRREELLRLIRDVPLNTFGNQLKKHRSSDEIRQDEIANEIKRELLFAYREKLHKAKELYRTNDQEPPNELVQVIEHLDGLYA